MAISLSLQRKDGGKNKSYCVPSSAIYLRGQMPPRQRLIFQIKSPDYPHKASQRAGRKKMLCADLDRWIPSRQIVTPWHQKTLQLTTDPLTFLFSLWGLENPNPSHSCFILAPLILIPAEARYHRAAETLKRNAPHFIKTRTPNPHSLGKYTSQVYFICRLILIRTSR